MTNEVIIAAFDQDILTVAGNALVPTANTSSIYNGYAVQGTGASGDNNKYSRYFHKGGVYRITIIYGKNTDAGKISFGIDSNQGTQIVSALDMYGASQTYNNTYTTFVEIARGFHDISTYTNSKNASSSAYKCYLQAIEFDLVVEYPVNKDMPPAGSLKAEWIEFAMSDENSTVVSGTGTKATIFAPFTGAIVYVYASATTAPTGGTVLKLDLKIASTSIFLTLPAFVASSTTSTDGVQTSNPVTFTKGQQIDAVVNQVDSGATTKGLKMYALVFRLG